MVYRYFILALFILVFACAGFYFNSSGGSAMLTKAISQTTESEDGVSLSQLFAGEYDCAESDGCAYPVKIVLVDDTTFELIYTDPESGEVVQAAQGTWGVASSNKLVLLVDKRVSQASLPNSIHAVIDTMKIKEFSKKKVLFSWVQNPVFTRTSN